MTTSSVALNPLKASTVLPRSPWKAITHQVGSHYVAGAEWISTEVSSGGGIVVAVEVVAEAGLRVAVLSRKPEIDGNRFYLYLAIPKESQRQTRLQVGLNDLFDRVPDDSARLTCNG